MNLFNDMILVFDLSGVFFNEGLRVAVNKISKEFKLNPKTVEFVLNGSFAQEYRTGLIKTEEFWKKAKEYLKIDDNLKINRIKKIFPPRRVRQVWSFFVRKTCW